MAIAVNTVAMQSMKKRTLPVLSGMPPLFKMRVYRVFLSFCVATGQLPALVKHSLLTDQTSLVLRYRISQVYFRVA